MKKLNPNLMSDEDFLVYMAESNSVLKDFTKIIPFKKEEKNHLK